MAYPLSLVCMTDEAWSSAGSPKVLYQYEFGVDEPAALVDWTNENEDINAELINSTRAILFQDFILITPFSITLREDS